MLLEIDLRCTLLPNVKWLTEVDSIIHFSHVLDATNNVLEFIDRTDAVRRSASPKFELNILFDAMDVTDGKSMHQLYRFQVFRVEDMMGSNKMCTVDKDDLLGWIDIPLHQLMSNIHMKDALCFHLKNPSNAYLNNELQRNNSEIFVRVRPSDNIVHQNKADMVITLRRFPKNRRHSIEQHGEEVNNAPVLVLFRVIQDQETLEHKASPAKAKKPKKS